MKIAHLLFSALVLSQFSFALPAKASFANRDIPTAATFCAAEDGLGSEEEICLTGLSMRTHPEVPTRLGRLPDALARNAVRQAIASGRLTEARAFVRNAADHLSLGRLEAVVLSPGPLKSFAVPRTPFIGRGTGPAMRGGYGNPQFQTEYVDYWNIRSDGTRRLISTTRLEFSHYIGIDSSDWGRKALAVHLTKSQGRDTYYSDAVCEMKHVDWWADSVVLRWGKCGEPNHNSVNNFDMYRSERDFYGNRGDKYYNEIWFDINPSGAEYDTLRANREGPKWRNPDGGGEPRWL